MVTGKLFNAHLDSMASMEFAVAATAFNVGGESLLV